jgi:hypothetical protein
MVWYRATHAGSYPGDSGNLVQAGRKMSQPLLVLGFIGPHGAGQRRTQYRGGRFLTGVNGLSG